MLHLAVFAAVLAGYELSGRSNPHAFGFPTEEIAACRWDNEKPFRLIEERSLVYGHSLHEKCLLRV